MQDPNAFVNVLVVVGMSVGLLVMAAVVVTAFVFLFLKGAEFGSIRYVPTSPNSTREVTVFSVLARAIGGSRVVACPVCRRAAEETAAELEDPSASRPNIRPELWPLEFPTVTQR